MIALQDSNQFLSAVSTPSGESSFVLVTEASQEPRDCVEPGFGCVDWYLYPPVLEAAAG